MAALTFTACNNVPQTSDTAETEIPITTTETHSQIESGTFAITTTTSTETTTVTTTPQTEEFVVTTAELPFEDTALNAYERLSLSFVQPDGNEIAPDDYAGAYAYGGTLFVCMTSRSPGEYYTDLLADYTCVRYKTVKHSL